jgi:CHASE2 domain-containing sensor protein
VISVSRHKPGEVWVHYGAFLPDRYISATDVLERRVDRATFKDKIVIVAMTGLGVVDFQTTARGEYVPGAEVHAQLVESFFDGRFLSRPPWMPAAETGIPSF